MDPHDVEYHLRSSTKNICKFINSQLLFSLKYTSSLKLLLHNIILIYMNEMSKNFSEKIKEKQHKDSIKSMRTIYQTMSSSDPNQAFIYSGKNIQDLVTLDRFSNDIPILK